MAATVFGAPAAALVKGEHAARVAAARLSDDGDTAAVDDIAAIIAENIGAE